MKSKQFSHEVLDVFEREKICGLNIPDIQDDKYLKEIGIPTISQRKALQRLFATVMSSEMRQSRNTVTEQEKGQDITQTTREVILPSPQ